MTHLDNPPKDQLTPSELVFLHRDQFAKKAALGKVLLLHTEAAVSAVELGRSILLSAFLAAERAGGLVFEFREVKKFLNLRKVQSLFAVPGGSSANWPEGSLEAEFSKLARQLANRDKNDVRTIVYEWPGKDSGIPWRLVVEKLQAGMAGRGLLETRQEKKWGVFSVTHYSPPETTAALRRQEEFQPVRQMIEDCRQGRAEVFGLLEKQVNKAIQARTDQGDSDSWNPLDFRRIIRLESDSSQGGVA